MDKSLVIKNNDNIINETGAKSVTEDIYNIEHVEQSNSTSTEKNEDSLNKSKSLISTTESKGT